MKPLQQAGIVPACLLWCMLCVQTVCARVDSVRIVQVDTVVAPFKALGQIMTDSSSGSTVISKTNIRRMDYRSVPELLQRSTAAYPRFTGGFGQHNAMTFMGEDPANHVYSVNGRHVFDPWSWRLHTEQLSVEGIERIEILHGTDAIGLGGGMGLHAINMQQIIYDTKTPITRLWYAQGGGEFLATDVTLSQNVTPSMNATVGLRRSGAIGRFDQTDFDIWNVRSAFRWTPSRRMHVQVSYDLASLNTDLWGGVNAEDMTTITEATAIPVFETLRDLTRRHDLQATAAYLPNADSSTIMQATAYASLSSIRRLRSSSVQFLFPDDSTDVVSRGYTYGMQVRLQQQLGALTLRAGASLDALHHDESPVAASVATARLQTWVHGSLRLTSVLDLRVAARLLQDQYGSSTGGGVALHCRASSASTYVVDISTAPRYAGPTEITSVGQRPLSERHVLARVLASYNVDRMTLSAEAFYRSMADVMAGAWTRASDILPVIVAPRTDNRGSASILGAMLRADGRWKNIEFRSTLRVVRTSTEDAVTVVEMPLISGNLTAAYVFETASNSVRLGTTIGMQTATEGPGFSPLTWTMVSRDVTQALTTNGVDAYVSATVGNADIRLAFENILGVPWFSVAGYPEISRNFRLSVHWSFFD